MLCGARLVGALGAVEVRCGALGGGGLDVRTGICPAVTLRHTRRLRAPDLSTGPQQDGPAIAALRVDAGPRALVSTAHAPSPSRAKRGNGWRVCGTAGGSRTPSDRSASGWQGGRGLRAPQRLRWGDAHHSPPVRPKLDCRLRALRRRATDATAVDWLHRRNHAGWSGLGAGAA